MRRTFNEWVQLTEVNNIKVGIKVRIPQDANWGPGAEAEVISVDPSKDSAELKILTGIQAGHQISDYVLSTLEPISSIQVGMKVRIPDNSNWSPGADGRVTKVDAQQGVAMVEILPGPRVSGHQEGRELDYPLDSLEPIPEGPRAVVPVQQRAGEELPMAKPLRGPAQAGQLPTAQAL